MPSGITRRINCVYTPPTTSFVPGPIGICFFSNAECYLFIRCINLCGRGSDHCFIQSKQKAATCRANTSHINTSPLSFPGMCIMRAVHIVPRLHMPQCSRFGSRTLSNFTVKWQNRMPYLRICPFNIRPAAQVDPGRQKISPNSSRICRSEAFEGVSALPRSSLGTPTCQFYIIRHFLSWRSGLSTPASMGLGNMTTSHLTSGNNYKGKSSSLSTHVHSY